LPTGFTRILGFSSQLQQKESKVFLHSVMIEALDKMKNRAKAERNAACVHVAYRRSEWFGKG